MNDFEIPNERDLPPGRLERRRSHLVRELTARRRRRRLVLSLVPAVAVLLIAATGFTAYVLRTEPSTFSSIGCYGRADLSADVSVVSPDPRGPLALCRELWEQGEMGSPVPDRLAACVLNTGPVGVFPSSDERTCERMGLADLSEEAEAEGKRFVQLRDAIFARIGEPPSGSSRGSSLCVGEKRARALVRRELDAHGYADWGIVTAGDGFTPDRPCAEPSFDGSSKSVLLVAGARN